MIQVLLFASLREAAGVERVALPSDVGSPAGAFEALTRRYPALTGFRDKLLVAVNQAFADWNQPLQDGDEVAFFPPVSGGSHP
ncbi:MAG: molybdopterin synthase sulfur carrier subunit [Acidobacteriota bacterium]